MSDKLVTIDDGCPLEEAARVMVDNRVSGLPVLHDGELAGIITETDLFRIFLELLGAREHGLRLTLLVPNKRGMLASLAGAIAGLGGDIITLGTFTGDKPDKGLLTLKIRNVDQQKLVGALKLLGVEVIDLREA